METSKYYAVKELLKLQEAGLPLSMKSIIQMITNHDYSVIPYNMKSPNKRKLFEILDVIDIAENHRGFSVCSEHGKFVFYKQTLSTQDRRVVLSHELGHVSIGHFSEGVVLGKLGDLYNVNFQEQEANEFALYLLAPVCVLKKCGVKTVGEIKRLTLLDDMLAEQVLGKLQKHDFYTEEERELCSKYKKYIHKTKKNILRQRYIRKLILSVLIAIVLLAVCIGSRITVKSNTTYEINSEYETAMPTDNINEPVYITRTGTKYHFHDCRTIKDKNKMEISLEEAVKNGYTPCKICIGKE